MRRRGDQAGVVTRRQLLAQGWSEADVRRAVRRRELQPVHRGVYVDHTGPPTWEQRAWAAVLYAWPSALAGVSALRVFGLARTDDQTIHVAVDRTRTVVEPPGVTIHRRTNLNDLVAWHLGPPRLRLEEAVIDVATEQSRRLDAVALISEAVGSRRTTAERLAKALDARARVPDRAWLRGVLEDIHTGTWSVLEHGFLERVERPHGLPSGLRQVRHVGEQGTAYRDLVLPGLAIIELDGLRHHGTTHQRDRDLERDLDAAADELTTIRLGWGQVFDRPCSTAHKLAEVLQSLGWNGSVRPCGPSCARVSKVSGTR